MSLPFGPGGAGAAFPNCQSNVDFHETILGFKKLKSSPLKNSGHKTFLDVAVTREDNDPRKDPAVSGGPIHWFGNAIYQAAKHIQEGEGAPLQFALGSVI